MENDEQKMDKTENGNTEQAKLKEEVVQHTTELMREHEQRLIEAVLKGPGATAIALEMIIQDLERFQDVAVAEARANLIAKMFGGELPDCGYPDCPNHAEARAKAAAAAQPTETELHDATDAGANVSEQPMPADADQDLDDNF